MSHFIHFHSFMIYLLHSITFLYELPNEVFPFKLPKMECERMLHPIPFVTHDV